jgi:hypothetical protein
MVPHTELLAVSVVGACTVMLYVLTQLLFIPDNEKLVIVPPLSAPAISFNVVTPVLLAPPIPWSKL